MTKLQELTEEIRRERSELIKAMRDDNQQNINRHLYRLTGLNSKVSDMVMDMLEKNRYTNADNTIGTSISPSVDISDNSPLHLGSPDGFVAE